MSPLLTVILASSIGNFFLGFFVLTHSQKDTNNLVFGLLGIATGLWGVSNFAYQLFDTTILLKLTYTTGAVVTSTAALWITQKSGLPGKRFLSLIFIILGLLFAFLPTPAQLARYRRG